MSKLQSRHQIASGCSFDACILIDVAAGPAAAATARKQHSSNISAVARTMLCIYLIDKFLAHDKF